MFDAANEILILLVAVVATTAVLLSAGAVGGYWAGLRAAVGRIATGADQSSLEVWRHERAALLLAIDRCTEKGQQAAQQSERVAELAQQHALPVASGLAEAIDGLTTTTRKLARQLEEVRSAGQTPASLPAPGAERTADSSADDGQRHRNPVRSEDRLAIKPQVFRAAAPGAAVDSKLTSDEMSDVIGAQERQVNEAQVSEESQRFPYDCEQQMAPWYVGDDPPTASQLIPVRCHDISASGVSFFLPDKPEFEAVAISIGSGENAIFMAAEVRHHKAVYMHEQVSYLVGCRFLRRLDALAREWKQRTLAEESHLWQPAGVA